MPHSTDHPRLHAQTGRSLALLLGLAPLVGGVGCARLQTLKTTTESRIGALISPPPSVGSIRGDDSYAGRMRNGTAPNGEGLADASHAAGRDRGELIAPLDVGLQIPPIEVQVPPVFGSPTVRPVSSVSPGRNSARSAVESARKSLDAIGTYRAAMTRRERVAGSLTPSEDVILSVRRRPMAVRLEWPTGPNAGREVLYEAAPGDGLLHVMMPKSIISRTSLPLDSPFVAGKSRHPITEAGFDSIVATLESDLNRPGSHGLVDGGIGTVEGDPDPLIRLERTRENGETWVVGLDPSSFLPVLVLGRREDGELLESYRFRDVQADPPSLAAADAFRPEVAWGPAPGLFGRR